MSDGSLSPVHSRADSLIDLSIGQPSLSLLPVAALETAAGRFFAQKEPYWLQYGADQGELPFRESLAALLSRRTATAVSAAHLMATAGVSQALDLVCTRFTKPGDTIVVEEPTYFLALEVFRDHGLRVLGVPMDSEGMSIEALQDIITRHRPAFVYTVPTFQNPTGTTLSAARRHALLDACEAHDVLIVADEVYHLLDFGTAPPTSLATHTTAARVLSLGSFSKICAPGLRLGWIHGAPALLDILMQSGLVQSGGGLNPFTSGIMQQLLDLGLADAGLDALKDVYRHRSAVLCEALRTTVPEVTFVEPRGGYFVWAQLPSGVSAVALQPFARAEGVGYHSGRRFVSREAFDDTMRLSFAHYDAPDLVEGVARLARALAAYRRADGQSPV